MGLFGWGAGGGCAPKEPYWYYFFEYYFNTHRSYYIVSFSYLQDFNLLIYEIFSDEYNLELIYGGSFMGLKMISLCLWGGK